MHRTYRVREDDKRLPEKFYREHLLHFPLVTVDLVVTDERLRFLLVKRSRENLNWKGVWATPGGRVFRNERLRDAAQRVLLREVGLNATAGAFTFRGLGEIVTTKEHGVTAVFSVNVKQTKIYLDKSSSSARWFTVADAPRSLRPQYATILKVGGVPFEVSRAPISMLETSPGSLARGRERKRGALRT